MRGRSAFARRTAFSMFTLSALCAFATRVRQTLAGRLFAASYSNILSMFTLSALCAFATQVRQTLAGRLFAASYSKILPYNL
ncbi:MAG: hypothetical protein AAF903_06655 [Pseudomonadota bacterium]